MKDISRKKSSNTIDTRETMQWKHEKCVCGISSISFINFSFPVKRLTFKQCVCLLFHFLLLCLGPMFVRTEKKTFCQDIILPIFINSYSDIKVLHETRECLWKCYHHFNLEMG